MTDLKQLTVQQLKQFISENRTDDEKFGAALDELMSRNPNRTVYPYNMPPEEMQRVLDEKLEQMKRSQQQ